MTAKDVDPLPDTLNADIGVLARREAEARILAPVIDALGAEFGRQQVIDLVRRTIVDIARRQGAALANNAGGDDAAAFLGSLENWTRNDALRIEVQNHDDRHLDFNVTRCRYAELYRALDIPELGAVLSCNRDFALIDGFNPDAELDRPTTLMAGDAHCEFRYRFPKKPAAQ